ncbi:hypothetical protein PHAVU_006G112800 [Phaseolus vulgaris]|uniref:Uncharacterized protein n=1 Tax=Phaseolus vulgaris TaxID=3885 RepID=V7BMT7_PHAVU|nr:hypothetical protein PHAVU_006G112800g [Phaseolus vulgaris]ESW19299.1 hypothetical protein PHAVU_006G112800g [Phaseolus vulgaris]
MSVLFVFSLFLLLNVPNSCIAQKNYSSFVLIQQWPKGFCRMIGGFCTMKPNKFTIYGLWPLRPNGRPIKYCNTDSNLSEDDIKPLEKQLSSNWPSLGGLDFAVWYGQWKVHGTCSENEFTKLEYFQLALDNYAQNDLRDILKKANIVPDEQKHYNRSSVVAAVHQHTQHDPQLVCYFDSVRNVSVLYQIAICYADDGKSYKNCVSDFIGNCSGTQLLIDPK